MWESRDGQHQNESRQPLHSDMGKAPLPEFCRQFINPKNKMAREYVGEVLGLEGGDAAVKQRYKKHKDAAVAAAEAFLLAHQDEKWRVFFQGLKKKTMRETVFC